MISQTSPISTTTTPLTAKRQEISDEIARSATLIINEIARDLLVSQIDKLSGQQFQQRYVASRLQVVDRHPMTLRTRLFLQKMHQVIDEEIKAKYEPLVSSILDDFACDVNNPQLRNDFVKGITFPHTLQLIKTFDDRDVSIIDQIVGIKKRWMLGAWFYNLFSSCLCC